MNDRTRPEPGSETSAARTSKPTIADQLPFDPWRADELAARKARDHGIQLALGAQAADQDRLVIDQAIRHLARTGRDFTADDVRDLLPVVNGSLIGARFLAAGKAKLIERAGATQSRHPEGHARLIRVWRGRQP